MAIGVTRNGDSTLTAKINSIDGFFVTGFTNKPKQSTLSMGRRTYPSHPTGGEPPGASGAITRSVAADVVLWRGQTGTDNARLAEQCRNAIRCFLGHKRCKKMTALDRESRQCDRAAGWEMRRTVGVEVFRFNSGH